MNKNIFTGKKAQGEVLGVAIIVIMLVIIGTFLLLNNLRKKELTFNNNPELAQRFLNTLMNTMTKKDVTVSDAIKNCYGITDNLCGQTTTSDCCSYAYSAIKNTAEDTLQEWGKSYRITIRRGDDKRIKDIPENGNCKDYSEKWQPATYTIPSPYTDPVVIKLDICKI